MPFYRTSGDNGRQYLHLDRIKSVHINTAKLSAHEKVEANELKKYIKMYNRGVNIPKEPSPIGFCKEVLLLYPLIFKIIRSNQSKIIV